MLDNAGNAYCTIDPTESPLMLVSTRGNQTAAIASAYAWGISLCPA
jgi:hypothetical protein